MQWYFNPVFKLTFTIHTYIHIRKWILKKHLYAHVYSLTCLIWDIKNNRMLQGAMEGIQPKPNRMTTLTIAYAYYTLPLAELHTLDHLDFYCKTICMGIVQIKDFQTDTFCSLTISYQFYKMLPSNAFQENTNLQLLFAVSR